MIDDTPVARRAARIYSPLDLIGTRYTRGGVTPEQGFDCFTLAAYVRHHWFARETPVGPIPARKLAPMVLCALCIRRALGHLDPLSPWRACPARDGCMVGLGRSRIGRLHHCGVWIEGGVLHALEGVGVAWTPCERLSSIFPRAEFYECRD